MLAEDVGDKRRDEEYKYSPSGISDGGTRLGCVQRCGNMRALMESRRPISRLRRPRIDEGLNTANEKGWRLECSV